MFLDTVILALKSLLNNKLRSSLSILWVIIWVFTIVLVISISRWVENIVSEQLKFLNVTSIFVEPADTVISKSKLDWDDVYHVLSKSNNLAWATTMAMWKWNIIANNKSESFNVIWTTETFVDVMSFELGFWEYFSKKDIVQNWKVVVVWESIVTEIFNWNYNIIWKSLFVWNSKFKIIWILRNSPAISWFSFDDAVYLPYTTAKKFVIWDTSMMALVFLASSVDTVNDAVLDIRKFLREAHKLRDNDVDDFNVYEQKTMLQAVDLITKAISFLLIWVAWIILVVSWIGIMNVMFAWVAEKIKDIWIMRAIWARKKDIMTQFLIESVVLTFVWWVIWILMWEWLIALVNTLSPDIQLVGSLFWNLFALAFAVVIWIFFWLYPAKKATKLDVVESLK